MPYVTVRQTPRMHQVTLEDILKDEVGLDAFAPAPASASGTVTRFRETLNPEFVHKFDIHSMILALRFFAEKHAALYDTKREDLYDTFQIPKKTGGLRTINAPHPKLMAALRELKAILEKDMFALYHTSAFAYVPSRSTLDAIKRHQLNQSRWFLKTDFSDFFGSSTPEFIMRMLEIIFPFSEIVREEGGREALSKALDLCFLNGGLPQGTPISPMLTNLMMIPIDHELFGALAKDRYVYTRYADDIQISHRVSFDQKKMVAYIDSVLEKFGAPFKIKPQKTRYGSSAGRNWNLGLMLNKDNDITIGWRKKKQFKAMCCNFVCDSKSGVRWDIHDLYTFSGLIAYYKMIEPEYIEHVIAEANSKWNVNLKAMLRAAINGY